MRLVVVGIAIEAERGEVKPRVELWHVGFIVRLDLQLWLLGFGVKLEGL